MIEYLSEEQFYDCEQQNQTYSVFCELDFISCLNNIEYNSIKLKEMNEPEQIRDELKYIEGSKFSQRKTESFFGYSNTTSSSCKLSLLSNKRLYDV